MTERVEVPLSDLQPQFPSRPYRGCPSISVVIPCYNAEKWIARSIQSVLDQQNVNLEVIVIDDGSADKSVDIIKSFGNQVRWRSGPNRGACTARNCGLDWAGAGFIIFLDADDYIEPDSIRHWAALASDADLVFGPFAYEIGGRRTFGQPPSGVSTDSILFEWLNGWFIPSCSVLWRRSFLREIGGWNQGALRNQDGEVVLRGLLKGARVAVAQCGLGIYVQHQNPDRVSKGGGRRILASELSSFENLWRLAQAEGRSGMQKNFAQAFYRIAYEAFATGVDDIGRLALSRARRMGLKGHPGTFVHQMLSHILGLRNKLRFTGIVRRRPSTGKGLCIVRRSHWSGRGARND